MRRMIPQNLMERAKKAVIAVVVSNIKQIPDKILSSLKSGDIVQKEDSSGKHSYIVSFKKDGTGICLTYTDASVVETQSYDFTDGHWVYNSEDKMPLVNVENASSGEIVDALGLDAEGHLVKGQAGGGGGTKLYKHFWKYTTTSGSTTYTYWVCFVSKESNPINLATANLVLKGWFIQDIPQNETGFTTKCVDIIESSGTYYAITMSTSYSSPYASFNKSNYLRSSTSIVEEY